MSDRLRADVDLLNPATTEVGAAPTYVVEILGVRCE